ncbi:hypothetical protein BDZ45DRAFT_752803 [Acephala macrosclerotiorum]|nr:hypothetical protein BDZ45DRAFT_752803 [Acephala macrosclerotiorum]
MAQLSNEASTQLATLLTSTALSTSTTCTKPTTFHPFPRLPIELKLKIWNEFNEVEKRVVQVTFTRKNDDLDAEVNFKLLTETPTILHICHDSRVEGLKSYPVTAFNTIRSHGTILKEIYVNPHLDTLIFIVPEWAQQLGYSDYVVMKMIEWDWETHDQNSVVTFGHNPSKSGYWAEATHSLVQIKGVEWEEWDDDHGKGTETLFLFVLPHAEYQNNFGDKGKDKERDDGQDECDWEPEEIAYDIAELLFPDIEFGGEESIPLYS